MSSGVKEWSPNQLRFIEWLATPSALRDPQFQRDLAYELGVKEETLSRWKRLDGLTAAASSLSHKMLGDDLPDIFGALRREAMSGSYQHIKLVLEVTGYIGGENSAGVNVNVSVDVNRADRDDRYQDLFGKLDAYRTGFDEGHSKGASGESVHSGRADDTPTEVP